MGFITGRIIDVLTIVATIIIGVYAYDEIRRQESSLKVMLIGIGLLLFAIVIQIYTLKIVIGVLGFITIIYGAKKAS